MAREYIAAYKEGSQFIPFSGGTLAMAQGERDYADAYEEYLDAQSNRHARPVMLVRENGKAWRQMSAGDMRRAAN